MQAHRGIRMETARLKQAEGAIHGGFGALETPQPVMPAHAVVAHLETRVHPTRFQTVEQCVIHQVPVRENRAQGNTVLPERIHDLPEVAADERLAARHGNRADTAGSHLLHQIQQLLGGGMAELGMRGAYQAVLAAVVALSRNRPVHIALVAAGVALVALLR